MTTRKTGSGGIRPGAGRPRGTTRGRHSVSRSITLPVPDWDLMDDLRGSLTRSKWVLGRVRGSKPSTNNPEANGDHSDK